MNLEAEVSRFKSWAAGEAQDYGEWETTYQEWHGLYVAAKAALSKPALDDVEMELLLYALARDNELEFIRDMLEEFPANGFRLAAAALTYADPDARWQIADFLGTLDTPEARGLLRRFVEDSDEYVRRRALLAAQKCDPIFAEEIARSWLNSPHEYSRLAALDILHELGSRYLTQALEQLREDPYVYVRERVAKIESEV